MTRRVTVVGGGPAGLTSARLIALRHPTWQVTVHERLAPGQAYGFGVGLSGDTMATLRRADEAIFADVAAAAVHYSVAEFRIGDEAARVPGFYSGAAISRAALLGILLRHAEAAGVDVEMGVPADLDALEAGATVLVAADGYASALRARAADAFGARCSTGRSRFIWLGCATDLPGNVFMPVRTDAGLFVAHAYPHAVGWSTLVVEADEATLKRAGLAAPGDFGSLDGPEGPDASDASDAASIAYLSECFAPLVDGRPLIGNRSRWFPFATVRCARWHHRNVVLVGDAAATAHPSLGSGTKLALESAITLADTLGGAPPDEPVPVTLARYERARRSAVDRLQRRAQWSERWWESYAVRTGLSPARAALSYLTRAAALSLDQIRVSSPPLVAQALAEWAGLNPDDVPTEHLHDWVLRQPLRTPWGLLGSRVLDGSDGSPAIATLPVAFEDAWGPDGDELAARASALVAVETQVLELTGEMTTDAILARVAMAERLRAELGVPVSVATAGRHVGIVADAIVAGRADLVTILDERGRVTGAAADVREPAVAAGDAR